MKVFVRTSADIIREMKDLIEFMCNCKLVEVESEEDFSKLANETKSATMMFSNKAWVYEQKEAE